MLTPKGKRRGFVCLVALITASLFLSRAASSESPPAASLPAKSTPEPKIEVEPESTTIPIKEEVKILRAERRQKMPYLDRKFIKETINKKTLQKKREFLGDLDKALGDVVNRALEISTPVKVSEERIKLARRRILVAARDLFPEIDFNFELRKGSLSAAAFTGRDYHFIFRLPVFRGGILWNTLLREKAEYRAAKKEYDATVNEVVDEVSKAYFEYNRAREVYEAKQELHARAAKQGRISKLKHEQALISEIEYLNAESLVSQVEYELETAHQELELAKLEVQRYLGLDVGDSVELASLYDTKALIEKGEPAKRLKLEQSLEELVDLAYRNRPELQVEAEKLRSARLEERINRGAFRPRADLLMEFGEMGESFISNADDPPHFPEWHLGFELTGNVLGSKPKYTFDNDENAPSVTQFQQGTGTQVTRRKFELGILNGLKDYAELKEAEVKKLEQVIELEKKEQEVIREVKEAYFEYHKAEVQVESSLKRNQYRERLVELHKIRLEKAEVEISEYLQAELDLAEERGKFHRALADLFKAKSKMNRAIGIRNFLPVEKRYGL